MSEYLTKRQELELVRSSLLLERSSFETHWRDLATYIRPRRTRFHVTDRNKGDRRNQKIIDSTGTFAARTLQSGMHAGISSPARPWLKLTTWDPELSKQGPVREWLQCVTSRMLTLFARSNLYNALPVLYGDMGIFATAAMAVVEDEHDFLRCYAYPVGSYALGLSERQIANTFVREYQMTVRQLVAAFGRLNGTREIDWTRFSQAVKTCWDRSQYEASVDVTWMITPNPEANPDKLGSKFLPFLSCYFENGQEDENKFLRESGFNEFPVLAPRWDVAGEDTYGTESPGMNCLGDVKALQLMQRRKAQLVELAINPSLQAPTSLMNQKVSLLPADVTFADATQANGRIQPIREVQLPALQYLTLDIQDNRDLIRRAFYEDLFLMMATSNDVQRTATEIAERHEEKLLALGPVLERTNDELLDPLVDRVYGMMERAGMVPDPPEEMQGQPLRVEYISILSQAQKMVGVSSQDRFIASTLPIIQIAPQARHKINFFQAIESYGSMLGVDPKIIVPDEEAKQAAAEEMQQIQAQRAAEMQAQSAKATRDLSQSPVNSEGDTALTQLMNTMRGMPDVSNAMMRDRRMQP